MLAAVLRQLRAHQWTKNLFVFAPVVFAKHLGWNDSTAYSVAAFIALCLASSAAYTVNDLMDADSDREHPKKRLRPIPSGQLTAETARGLAVLLFVLAFAGAATLGSLSVIALAAYVAATLGYSFGCKHVPLLEAFLLAAGFVIRVLMGSAATHIPSSPWLLLTTFFLALLLAFGKRRGEMGRRGESASNGRPVLEHYSLPFLDRSITLLAGVTLLCYAIYCTAEVTVRKMGTEWLVATTPFVAYGILRYLYIVEHGDHAADAPDELLLRDRPIQLAVLLWLATAIALIYTH